MKAENDAVEGVEDQEVDDYDQKLKFINAIATPMANKKLVKRLFKCVKKGKNSISDQKYKKSLIFYLI